MLRYCSSIKLNLTICSYNMPDSPSPNLPLFRRRSYLEDCPTPDIFSPVSESSLRPRPPPETSNPALCKQCNASLHLDDSFLEPLLKTSATGEPYLDYDDPIPKSVFEGIDYARHEQIPSLPDLSLAAESGCVFCAALRDTLHYRYKDRGSSWWTPSPIKLRIQYGWTWSGIDTHLDSVVVSIFDRDKLGWIEQDRRFLAYRAEGTSIHLCR